MCCPPCFKKLCFLRVTAHGMCLLLCFIERYGVNAKQRGSSLMRFLGDGNDGAVWFYGSNPRWAIRNRRTVRAAPPKKCSVPWRHLGGTWRQCPLEVLCGTGVKMRSKRSHPKSKIEYSTTFSNLFEIQRNPRNPSKISSSG